MTEREKEKLIDKLVEAAFLADWVPKKPGEVIKRCFTKEEREALMDLSSDDFHDRRL